MKPAAIVLIICLSGCSTIQNNVGPIHAACATFDVVTTIAALENGAVEANPLMAAVIDSGGYPLLIAINVLLIYLVWKNQEKKEVQLGGSVGAVVRCAAGVNNMQYIGW